MSYKIIFDTERMKHKHTGLYFFCKHLGLSLLKNQTTDAKLSLYYPDSIKKDFGDQVHYIKQKSLHKFWMPRFNNVDLWHSTYQLSSYFPSKGTKTKVLSTIHDLNFLKEGKSVQKEKYYLKKLQDNLDRADCIVAISKYVKNDLEQHCDLRGKPIHIVYNGNNIETEIVNQYHSAENNQHIRKQLLFTIGTVNHKKNFHVLPYLLVGNDLELVISGIVNEIGYDKYILSIAKELGVLDRVVITGPITEEEKYQYLSNCAMFVFPSIAEGFGLPVIEAMSFGKKVLLSTNTCLPEIGGEEAFFLDSTEKDYMINFGKFHIMNLINSTDRSSHIKKWAGQFSWDMAAKQYWNLYEEVLK
ncbi:glycosyltransferase family 4 protein [Sphingobacterium anhuiense]|uniref:Glycosyltransferase family 4 protein n=1 Tax=Sphingobacterium anhuiense TaxID=493780 RepID=A0ABW5Z3I6_9SPHI